MTLSRRSLFGMSALAGAALSAQSASAGVAGGMLSAGSLGVEANTARDQSGELQRALDVASASGGYLLLEPGLYIASGLRVRSSLNIVGVPGQTRLVQAGIDPILLIEGASGVRLDGLVVDGQLRGLPSGSSALVEARKVRDLTISNCLVTNSSGNGINLIGCSGAVTANTIETCTNAGSVQP